MRISDWSSDVCSSDLGVYIEGGTLNQTDMKTRITRYMGMAVFFALPVLNGCTGDFGDINTDPSLVTDPDVKFLFTYSANALPPTGGAWIWESLEQTMRFTQQVTTNPYALTGNINSRYGR